MYQTYLDMHVIFPYIAKSNKYYTHEQRIYTASANQHELPSSLSYSDLDFIIVILYHTGTPVVRWNKTNTIGDVLSIYEFPIKNENQNRHVDRFMSKFSLVLINAFFLACKKTNLSNVYSLKYLLCMCVCLVSCRVGHVLLTFHMVSSYKVS